MSPHTTEAAGTEATFGMLFSALRLAMSLLMFLVFAPHYNHRFFGQFSAELVYALGMRAHEIKAKEERIIDELFRATSVPCRLLEIASCTFILSCTRHNKSGEIDRKKIFIRPRDLFVRSTKSVITFRT